MQPEEEAVLKILQSWSPDVTGLLHRAGYFNLPEGTKKEEIANKIGFGPNTPLYNRIKLSSIRKNGGDIDKDGELVMSKNRGVAQIVLDEQNLIELKQGAREVAKQLGVEFSRFDWNPIAQEYLDKEGFKLVKTLTKTDLDRIIPIIQQHFGLNERTFAKRFRDNYPCSEGRMRVIFRQEKFRAINNGADLLAKEAGAKKKFWRHSHGPNPRKEHLAIDGQERDIDKAFSTGEQLPEKVGCRCRVDYSF
jgi:hypothetical protein